MALSYKIIGRRVQGPIDLVDVEWYWSEGPVTDYHDVPTTILRQLETTHKKQNGDEEVRLHYEREVTLETRKAGTRSVIRDQINVPPGTPDSIVMQILEEKRPRLAANLGVE